MNYRQARKLRVGDEVVYNGENYFVNESRCGVYMNSPCMNIRLVRKRDGKEYGLVHHSVVLLKK